MLPLKFKDFYTLTFVDVGYYNPDDPILGVVHCPGLICMKTNRAIVYGVVVKEPQGLALWGAMGNGLPDNSAWEDDIQPASGLFNRSDYLLDGNLTKEQKKYFRALNLYHRILPDEVMVSEFLGVYLDEGTLTRAQRAMVDEQLFAGSDFELLFCNYNILCCLDVLSALGNQPGLDQSKVHYLMATVKAGIFDEKEENFIFDNLKKFSPLIRPLSVQLVADWPPKARVLTLP